MCNANLLLWIFLSLWEACSLCHNIVWFLRLCVVVMKQWVTLLLWWEAWWTTKVTSSSLTSMTTWRNWHPQSRLHMTLLILTWQVLFYLPKYYLVNFTMLLTVFLEKSDVLLRKKWFWISSCYHVHGEIKIYISSTKCRYLFQNPL